MSDLIIKISAEDKEFKDAVDGIKQSTQGLEDKLTSVAKVSGVAFAALTAVIGTSVKAYAESEKATKELTLALQNQGIYSDKTAESYKKFAEIIQLKTGIDDDALVSAQATLQSFLGQTEVTQELTQAIADLSIKTGSTTSAAEILGRAVQGNVRGLKQFGVTVDEGLPRNERLAAILQQVGQKFGGLAVSANSGLGGVKGFEDSIASLREEIGKRFADSFTKGIEKKTEFLRSLAKNEELLDFIANILKIGVVITGAALAFSTAAFAVVKITEAFRIAKVAVEILGISTRVAVGATGIGLLLIIASEIYLNWNKIFPAIQAVYQTFAKNVSEIASALGDILLGAFNPITNFGRLKDGLSKLKAIIITGFKAASDAVPKDGIDIDVAIKPSITQDDGKLAAAKAANAKLIQAEQDKQDVLDAQKELVLLESQKASDVLIDLKKKEIEILKQFEDEKYKNQRDALIASLEENQAIQLEQQSQDDQRNKAFADLQLANQLNFYGKTEAERDQFLQRNRKALLADTKTATDITNQAIAEEAKAKVLANNKKLDDQVKYGATFATINAQINSQTVADTQKAGNQLIGLQSSKNAELKALGKAAAVTQIGIDTARGAMQAYTSLLFIPFAGPILGAIAAAAVVAYGGERIANVVSAADGGVIPGFNRGGDSVHSFLQPGELVVPRSNFDETVNAVASQRSANQVQATSGVGGGSGGGSVMVDLRFSGDNAEKFLTAKQVESRSLGTIAEATA